MSYEQSELKNGLRLATTRLEGRKSIGLGIWVKVGGRYESKKLSGVSHFVEHMLFKGTRQRSTKEIKQAVEGVGGMLNAFTGEESTCYFVKIPRNHFNLAFDVIQDMVNQATLKTEEFNKEKPVILEEIKMYLDLPSQHVHELMSELLWPSQPLGQPIAGTASSVAAMTRNHLANHVSSFYHPQNMLITICGEIDHEAIKQMSEQFFDTRVSKSAAKFQSAKTGSRDKSARFKILDKKTEQTHLVLGFHGLRRNDPFRYQLGLLNIILGGNMSSRLFEEVREQRGLAYEIKSGLSFFEDTGSVTISAGVEPKKAPLAIRIIMRELSKIKKDVSSIFSSSSRIIFFMKSFSLIHTGIASR